MPMAAEDIPHVSGIEFQFTGDGRKKDRHTGQFATAIKIKESLSSNGRTRYTTTLWSDNVLTCDCPGWCIKRAGASVRTCKHCKKSLAHGCVDMTDLANFTPTAGAPTTRSQIVIPQRNSRNIHIRD